MFLDEFCAHAHAVLPFCQGNTRSCVAALASFAKTFAGGGVPYGASLAYWAMQGENFTSSNDAAGLAFPLPAPMARFWPQGGIPVMVTHFLTNVKTMPGLAVRPEAVFALSLIHI